MPRNCCILTVLILLAIGTDLRAADTASPSTHSSDAVAIGDRLSVGLLDLTGPGTRTVFTPLVESDGAIGLPLVPPVVVAGKSTDDVAAAVRDAYRQANLIEDCKPIVKRIESAAAPTTGRGPLKVGEKVVVEVCDLEEPGAESRTPQAIDSTGAIKLPHVTGSIAIAGLTEREAADRIAKELIKQNLIGNPQVDVTRS